ncbi:uncharacterized protein CC84DRAFT_1193345 [Paraphaeosphaeria sporulosa]|uniref:Uncharacterized protein n=1 Tax=Paraphaeosphaeria sporulosa TaxID=1460663 RepID=A0A177CRR6_9PLEO|nr:uncharacterized protein CC84DRAFT_1193345 [Paraphaeosphaeria sporulosa]OAG09580.1 hypothetical protein CC84DRAFT_1193345 [Paraphaeosphaeria sporulosa]
MNNFSFLDSGPQPPLPRAAPSPSPSPTSTQANGMPGPGPQQNGIPMVNGLPSGGQQTDMNHLWSVVQQLSQMLEENRAQTAGIVNGVQAIQARASEEGGVGGLAIREVNGEINAATRAAEVTQLQSSLHNAQSRISTLTSQNSTLATLLTDYENALTLLLDKLRPYAYTQTQAILSLHKHYQGLLEQERATSMQLRLEHSEWQAGLGRVAEYARGSLKAQGESERGLRSEIKGLKEENRVLRRLAGWEEKPDDSSDEEELERS